MATNQTVSHTDTGGQPLFNAGGRGGSAHLELKPLQSKFRVAVHEALRGGIHRFDLAALLHQDRTARRLQQINVTQ